MRHGIRGRKFSRTSSQRKALFSGLACALITHEQITTTLPKAKDLRPFVEKLVTLGKKGNLTARRQAIAILRSEEVVNKLFSEIATRYSERQGGYLRIMKAGFRNGDSAPVGIIEFVDRNIQAKGKADRIREAEFKKLQAELAA